MKALIRATYQKYVKRNAAVQSAIRFMDEKYAVRNVPILSVKRVLGQNT